jgi:hypothetical protein
MRDVMFRQMTELNGFYRGAMLLRCYFPALAIAEGSVVESKTFAMLDPGREARLFGYPHFACSDVGYLMSSGHLGALQWSCYVVTQRVRNHCR